MAVRMEIKGLILDPVSSMPVVVLRDSDQNRLLPIWVGVFEANAIALRMEAVESPRPMTHDLLKAVLDKVGYEVRKVVISDLRESTFFAEIHLSGEGRELVVDSRPSDAIALALRAGAEIFAAESVLVGADQAGQPSEPERLRKWLEEMSVEELGKYKM
jgi:uncharacterized protein